MARRIKIGDLTDPTEKRVLEDALNQLFQALDLTQDRLYPSVVTTDPNGSLSGMKGALITFDNGSSLVLKQNTDGSTTWRTVA